MKRQLTLPLLERPRVSFEERRALLRKYAPELAAELEIHREELTHPSGKKKVLEIMGKDGRFVGRIFPKES